jgi:hypothetical protein
MTLHSPGASIPVRRSTEEKMGRFNTHPTLSFVGLPRKLGFVRITMVLAHLAIHTLHGCAPSISEKVVTSTFKDMRIDTVSSTMR